MADKPILYGSDLNMDRIFDLTGKVVVITGGGGALGRKYAEAVLSHGGIPVLLDISETMLASVQQSLEKQYGPAVRGFCTDITQEDQVVQTCGSVLEHYGKIDALINNAANNPQVDPNGNIAGSSRLENFSLSAWEQDLSVGLTGAFLCAKYFGHAIAQNPCGGSIVNISSDLGVIAPDQRLYRKAGLADHVQPVKPVTYSVIKSGLIGLTRYLATYWPEQKVRCNALCPGGVFNGQHEDFVQAVSCRIPLGHMASPGDYQGAIIFLLSDASSYMTGAILVMDGGRSCW